MLIIPNTCFIPEGDHYGYDWRIDYSNGDPQYVKKPIEEVPKSSFIWEPIAWKINIIDSCPMSIRITVERQKDRFETNRTGLYCAKQSMSKPSYDELINAIKKCIGSGTEVNFCYPNESYRKKGIICGLKSVIKSKSFNLSMINRKIDTFLQY